MRASYLQLILKIIYMPFLESAAGAAAIGGIIDIANNAAQRGMNKRQYDRQKRLMQYSQDLSYDMWKKTGPVGQTEQLKLAGLNPGLIYGMGGAGGQTTGSPNATPAEGTVHTGATMQALGMGLQLDLMKAQKQLLESEAKKKEAETENIRGVQTEEARARIEDLWQGIDNKRQQHDILKVELALKHLSNYEAQASLKDRLDYIKYQTRIAMRNLEAAENNVYFQEATMQDKISIVRQEAIGAIIDNELKKANIDATKAQIDKWAKEIEQNWQHLNNEANANTIRAWEAEAKANFPGISQAIGRLINDGVESIFELTPRGRKGRYTIPQK